VKELTLSDISRSFGDTPENIPLICQEFLHAHNFRYRVLEGEEKDQTILRVLLDIENDMKRVDTSDRQGVWYEGWNENLQLFRLHKTLSSLDPKFIASGEIVRFNQQFIQPEDKDFEKNYIKLFQLWFFSKYMTGYNTVHEFGCGTGFNLAVIAKLFPEMHIRGYDYVQSSIDLVNEMAQYHNFDVQASFFDMTNPNYSVDIKNDCVFTCASIEQLGDRYHNFVDFLLSQKPSLCCHQEPLTELLDDSSLVDYLAIKFQKKRNYASGFLPLLQKLHNDNKIEILKIQRLYYGSTKTEGYNYVVWRPR